MGSSSGGTSGTGAADSARRLLNVAVSQIQGERRFFSRRWLLVPDADPLRRGSWIWTGVLLSPGESFGSGSVRAFWCLQI